MVAEDSGESEISEWKGPLDRPWGVYAIPTIEGGRAQYYRWEETKDSNTMKTAVSGKSKNE